MPCMDGLWRGEQRFSPKVNSGRCKLTTMLPGKTHPRETHPRKTHPTSPRGGCIIWGVGRAEAGGCPGASCLSHAARTQVLQLPQPSCPSLPVGTGQGTASPRATHSSKHSCSLAAERQQCLSEIFTLHHCHARAGASSQRDRTVRGKGHLSHSQASVPKVTAGHSRNHAGTRGDRSCGSLAVSSPCTAWEQSVLLNELQF